MSYKKVEEYANFIIDDDNVEEVKYLINKLLDSKHKEEIESNMKYLFR